MKQPLANHQWQQILDVLACADYEAWCNMPAGAFRRMQILLQDQVIPNAVVAEAVRAHDMRRRAALVHLRGR